VKIGARGDKVAREIVLKVVSRRRRFAKNFRSMARRNFDDTSNVKFLKRVEKSGHKNHFFA
jgi:VIT1/CCC1 family predicted Fe2+/Mn2+ transporter